MSEIFCQKTNNKQAATLKNYMFEPKIFAKKVRCLYYCNSGDNSGFSTDCKLDISLKAEKK